MKYVTTNLISFDIIYDDRYAMFLLVALEKFLRSTFPPAVHRADDLRERNQGLVFEMKQEIHLLLSK